MDNKCIYRLQPFKWFVLENFPFIEADFDAITNYQLLCKVVEYLNKTIDKTNELGNQVEALNNWFNNLDVQDEINNKLDEMAESGELVEIILQYLNIQSLICFNTLDDLKNSTNLINGSFVKIYGKNNYNDGLGAIYKIREKIETEIIDNNDITKFLLSNNLVAEKIHDFIIADKSNPIYYGADPTGTYDSSTAINQCIQFNKGNVINFSKGTYIVNQTINLPYKQDEKVSINGNGAKLINTNTIDSLFLIGFDKDLNPNNDVGYVSYIKDLFIDGQNSNTTYCIDIKKGYKDLKILNCVIYRFLNGVRIGESIGSPADVLITDSLIYGKGSEFDGTGIICNCTDNNINMTRIYGFRKCFIINGTTTIRECHGLLRWANQTSSNFDPYNRNGTEWNSYYPLTVFAEINSMFRCFNCYSDSIYKTLEINTDNPVISTGMNIYNARGDVNNIGIHIKIQYPKLIFANSSLNLGVHNICEGIHCDDILTNLSQIEIKNCTIVNIARLTNPGDLILSTQKNLIGNKTLLANTWYLVKIISNNSNSNIINGDLIINGYKYFLRFTCDNNKDVNSIIQANKGNGLSNWYIGTVTIDNNIYICVKNNNEVGNTKFDYKTNWSANLTFDCTPVKNNNVFSSSRLLNDYTNKIPNNELNLNNVLF